MDIRMGAAIGLFTVAGATFVTGISLTCASEGLSGAGLITVYGSLVPFALGMLSFHFAMERKKLSSLKATLLDSDDHAIQLTSLPDIMEPPTISRHGLLYNVSIN